MSDRHQPHAPEGLPFVGLILLVLPLQLVGCAASGAALEERFTDVTALMDARNDLAKTSSQVGYPVREVQGSTELRIDDSRARSQFTVKLARWQQKGSAQTLSHAVPPGASLSAVVARAVAPDGSVSVLKAAETGLSEATRPAYPGQRNWSARFEGLVEGSVVEMIAQFQVRGALKSDTQWLGMPDGPTAQVLVKYEVPKGGKGAFQAGETSAKATAAETPGGQVFGLFTTGQSAAPPDRGYARFVLSSANIRGHSQQWASSWSTVGEPYTAELLTRSSTLRGNHRAPFRAREGSADVALDAARWVRDRIQIPNALNASWRDGGPLPSRVTTNQLNATDKVHLLHWVLESLGVPHRVAAARSGDLTPLNVRLPVPEAFDTALIYLTDHQLWLDPSCQDCEPGQVHSRFEGGAALLLPVKRDEAPLPLPSKKSNAP